MKNRWSIGTCCQLHYSEEILNFAAMHAGTPYTSTFDLQNQHVTVLKVSNPFIMDEQGVWQQIAPHNVLVATKTGKKITVPIGNLFKQATFGVDPMPRPWAKTDFADHQLWSGDNREELERWIAENNDQRVAYTKAKGTMTVRRRHRKIASTPQHCWLADKDRWIADPSGSFVEKFEYEKVTLRPKSYYRFQRTDKITAKWLEMDIRSYGEGYLGDMHYQDAMPQLDRQIAEDCYNGSGKVQRPSMNVPDKAWHKKAASIVKRCRKYDVQAKRYVHTIDMMQADILVDAWKTMEATPAMITDFCRLIKTGAGSEFCFLPTTDPVAYFVDLAYEMAKLEAPPAAGHHICTRDAEDVENTIGLVKNETRKDLDYFIRPKSVNGYCEDIPALYGKNLARRWQLEQDDEDFSDIIPDDRELVSTRELAYANICYPDPADNWIASQPEWLTKAIEAVKTAKSQDVLSAIAKFAMKDERLKLAAPVSRMVFWGWYKAKRAQFRREAALSPNGAKTRFILQRLATADATALSKAAKWVFDIKDGNIASAWKPDKIALSQFWSAWKRRKRELGLF